MEQHPQKERGSGVSLVSISSKKRSICVWLCWIIL